MFVTIMTDLNSHIVHFKEPLRNPQYIKLLSCSLYNSFHNLKRDGQIQIFYKPTDQSYTPRTIPAGNYNIETLGAALNKKLYNKSQVEIYSSAGALVIMNPNKNIIRIDQDLSFLLNIKRDLSKENYINRLNGFNNYLINCDILSEEENIFN